MPDEPVTKLSPSSSGPSGRPASGDTLRALVNDLLSAIWDGIGPSGRDSLRRLNAELVDLSPGEKDRYLREFLRTFRHEIEEARCDPDLLVYGNMPAATADRLIALRDEGVRVIADSVLRVHDDPDAMHELSDALHAAPISLSQRERVMGGLRALGQPGETWAVPCDLLLGGVEGLMWELAEARNVVRIDHEGKPRDQRNMPVRSVNRTLDADAGLKLDESLRRFLLGRLLNSAGHDVRHRRRPELQREWTAYAIVALRGLLDETGSHQLVDALANRITSLSTNDLAR
jgi:hypothetical protein